MIVFGGGEGRSSPCENDTWVLSNANGVNGTPTWTALAVTAPTNLSPRIFHTSVYDPTSNRMIVFGGNNCFTESAVFYNDVWVLVNANGLGGVPRWIPILFPPGAQQPAARENHTAVYDIATNRMIIFGGASGTGILNDVWTLSNANGLGGTPAWQQVSLASTGPAPDGRAGHTAIYDQSHNQMLIYGGNNTTQVFGDAWILQNANGNPGAQSIWSQLTPFGMQPPVRTEHTAVYDQARQTMIAFGGSAGSLALTVVNDTWALTLTPPNLTATGGTPQSSPILTGFDAPLQVTVTDASNNPLAGVTVTFAAPSSGASTTLSSATAVTNNAGIASVTATANGTVGSYTVTATVPGITASVTFALTNIVGAPTSVNATGGTPDSATVNTVFASPLITTVTDAGGNRVSGITVAYRAPPSSGASGTFANGVNIAVTNSFGVATSAMFTANGTAGSYTVAATVANVAGAADFNLTNTASQLVIPAPNLPSGKVGTAYSAALSAQGGTPPYNWSLASGSGVLPSGLTLNASTGAINGTPTVAGSFNFILQVSDSGSPTQAVRQSLTITVVNTLGITTVTLPGGTAGINYGTALAAQGGVPPYSWSITSGSLASGVGLNPFTGALSGTPTDAGSFSLMVQVRDGNSPAQVASRLLVLTVTPLKPCLHQHKRLRNELQRLSA